VNESHSPQKPRRVIIVEDNALVAKFFRMALERVGGYSCTVTEDVPEMLKEIEAGAVDLVLLATAHTMSRDRERFLEASGADGYLEKSV
jgi:CheY-like chemotaxis protein